MSQDYPSVTIHKFKSDIARYLRALEVGRHKGIVIKRYDQPVGVVMAHPDVVKERGPGGAT